VSLMQVIFSVSNSVFYGCRINIHGVSVAHSG
jgi:hypothetical protein